MITIRTAVEADLPAILDIYNDVIRTTTAVYQYQPHTLDMRRSLFAAKQQEGYPVFVAEEENMILGLSTIGTFRAWQAYKYSVENSIYVAAAARGKGIGRLLMPPII